MGMLKIGALVLVGRLVEATKPDLLMFVVKGAVEYMINQ